MARPHRSDAHLRIAHELSEQIMSRQFTLRQRRILDLILRLSWGCDKEHACIPRKSDFQCAGIYPQDAAKEVERLVAQRVLFVDAASGTYAFNKDYESWQVTPLLTPFALANRLKELIALNVSGDAPAPDPALQQSLDAGRPAPDADKGSPSQADTDPALAQAASLYADNIGHLTPIIADQLKDLSAQYPAAWIAQAITEAARHEKRSLAYVTAILERWHREGFQSHRQKPPASGRPRQGPAALPSGADLQSAWNPHHAAPEPQGGQ